MGSEKESHCLLFFAYYEDFCYVTENGVNSNRFLHIIIRTIREEEYHEAESQRTGKINASYGRKSCKREKGKRSETELSGGTCVYQF